MSFKTVCYSCLFLLFVACQRKSNAPLSKLDMEKVLLDVHLAEVYSTMAGKDSTQLQGLKNNDSLAVYYQEVFTHHHINANQFMTSLDWYRAHPEELDSVYRGVLNTLEVTGKRR